MFENRPKVLFNIASEASYVYFLSEQKLIKNANKNDQFWKNWKWDFFGDFQPMSH